MAVIALTTTGPSPSVVSSKDAFTRDGPAILIQNGALEQLTADKECNTSYDLRVGEIYRDHRSRNSQSLGPTDAISLLPGNAVIIETEEWVEFPRNRFGKILPKFSLLQEGVANTPSKVDPGYGGVLLITAFNHGKQTVLLRRGQPFCSLHVFDVAGPVRPYDKGGKRILGARRRTSWILRTRDWIEANVAMVAFVQMAVAVLGLGVALFKS